MASTIIKAIDGNNVERLIFVPDWGESTPASSSDFPNQVYTDAADVIRTYPGFDNGLTFFTANDSNKAILQSKGFNNCFSVNDIGGRLTLSNGYSVIFSTTGSWGFRDPSDNVLPSNTNNILAGASTLPSFNTTFREGRTLGYVALSLYQLSSSGFRTGISNITLVWGGTYPITNGEAFWNGVTPSYQSSDPYYQGGESDTGGGEGNFDGTSVDVDFTSLPTLSAVDTGFITLYNPTVAQLQSLASYMWSGAFDLDTFKKLFTDPMQAILGLSIVPGPVPSSGSQVVKVGNISTGINMTKAASQYIDIDCGTLNVEEFWGAYLDYEPYTKAEIYLPYIGTHQIAVDDIMGKAVHIKYHIDILSGACAAEIKCGDSVLYTFIGSVAVSIPVTGNDWTNVINGVLSIAGAVGSLVATGGASAPIAAGEIASAAVNSLKPNIEKSGAVSGGGGLMAGKVPVLILTRPRQALPASQNEFTGYPAFITRSLGAVSGYTEVHKIRLGGISATDAELNEIENLLKGGVIL